MPFISVALVSESPIIVAAASHSDSVVMYDSPWALSQVPVSITIVVVVVVEEPQVTPVNVSFKWFVPATQEEEAKSVPLPSMSSHVGFATQQSDAAHVLVAHVTPVNVSFKWFVPATQEEDTK